MSKFAIRLLDAGNIRDGAGHGARRHHGLRRARRVRRRRPSDKSKKKKSSEVKPGIEDTAFAKGYRAAYATIYDRGDYAAAIAQLKALGRDDSAAVANLIGYSYRKLGDYKVAQIWYERALKADPEPRQDLAVLRPVAGRTGQPRSRRSIT